MKSQMPKGMVLLAGPFFAYALFASTASVNGKEREKAR